MDEKLIIESLSPIERITLPNIKREYLDTKKIAEKSSQDIVTTIRALEFLKKKGLVEIKSSKKKIVNLGVFGINYLKKELPERVLLNTLSKKRQIPIGKVKDICNLNENEAKIAIGVLRKKNFIKINKGVIELIPQKGRISAKMIEELFLEKLPLKLDSLEGEDKLAFDNLINRKEIIQIDEEKTTLVRFTELGEKISKMNINYELIEQLTPKMLKSGSWKGKKFRRYDISSEVPRIYGGKRHFVNQAKDYAKSIWLEMGFKEMTGNFVDIGFWVFDTLFTAQDHPVREMQDTFYLKGIKGRLPKKAKKKNECVVFKTQQAHEGGIGGSKGWQYDWSEEEAKKVLLRTHTTSLSIKKLMEIKENKEFPAKYFALGKCFRNETVDWSHGFEFYQTEGIVVDENANFRQLLGYLTQFYKKMGYEKIRIRPGYFAYTEPSLEIDMFHPVHKKWIELGGAGMFRPEVTIPIFGRHIPVLAWGQGFDRIITDFFDIKDLRELYKNDINKLREIKFWRK